MNIDLGSLSEDEQEAIWKVMLRYEEFKKRDEQRVLRLKSELQLLRKRGALRPGIDPERSCARCRVPLGHILNTGAICRACKLKICKACREYSRSGKYWICNVCYKLLQINAASGEWFYGGSQKSAEKGYLPLTQLVRRSIRQARRGGVKQPWPPDESQSNIDAHSGNATTSESPNACELSDQGTDDDSIGEASGFSKPAEPEASDTWKLKDLIVTTVFNRSPSPKIEVRRIHSGKYKDSDSESENETRTASPPASPKPQLRYKHSWSSAHGEDETNVRKERHRQTHVVDNGVIVQPMQTGGASLGPSLAKQFNASSTTKLTETVSSELTVVRPKPRSKSLTTSADESSESTIQKPHEPRTDLQKLFNSGTESVEALFRKVTLKKRYSPQETRKTRQTGNSSISNQLSPSFKKEQPFANEANRIPEISISEPKDSEGEVEKSRPEDDVFVEEDDLDKIFNPATRKQSSNTSNTGSRESVSLSLYSNAGEGFGKVLVTGEIMFGVSYNYRTRSLDILIKQCRDLAAVESKKSRSDPYVKTYLLPDKSKTGKRKTKIRKNTLNPAFDETLKYSITASEIQLRTLWISVWHNDTFGRNNFLGEVHAPLSNEVLRDSSPKWYKLQDRINSPDSPLAYKGDIVIALRYQPPDITAKKKIYNQKGSLHVLVKEAHNLVAVRGTSSDPFCKSYLLPEKSKNSKQKSQVIKRDCSPKWNHTFVFEDVTIDDLKDRAMELTIWDHDRLTSNEFLGGVRLGLGTGQAFGKTAEWNDARGEEIKIWQGMLNGPNTWVEETLELRPHMDYK